ncbi:MAG: acylphosphatase [Aigarchaeota archaeon]|nr:acylphosphatase [Aigarchaeota archaeon]MDW8092679.1 acylphosphatase [Nitrososphaerota archaeon]
MKVRARLRIHGKVQGVYFRHNTKSVADSHNVKGWVRNLPDGSVEAVLEGEQEDVTQVIEWCKVGPPAARVIKVEVEYGQYRGEFESFDIIQ